MESNQRIQDLRVVHGALMDELKKIYQRDPAAKLGFAEGEYDTADLWGRLTALGQLVSGLEGNLIGAGPSKIDFVVALGAAWDCFWELDRLLCGRGLAFAGRKGVLERVSGLIDVHGRAGAAAEEMDGYIAKLAE